MKAGHKKMVNRSSSDRRKTTLTSWKGVERRKHKEKRKSWERISEWQSHHKNPKTVDLEGFQLLP